MINLRMLALASALLLLLPVAALADPSDPSERVVEGGAHGVLEVAEVTLADLGDPREIDVNTTMATERLVEGHTTFATIDIVSRPVDTRGSVDVEALVTCTAKTGFDYKLFLGVIPYPTDVRTSTVDCLVDATLVAIPDPLAPSSMQVTPLEPTGVVQRFESPLGEPGYATEYRFTARWIDEAGAEREETRYAWTVPIMEQAWRAKDGGERNVFVPLPVERLVEMQLTDFRILDAREVPFSE